MCVSYTHSGGFSHAFDSRIPRFAFQKCMLIAAANAPECALCAKSGPSAMSQF
jgi:hypothetical protein